MTPLRRALPFTWPWFVGLVLLTLAPLAASLMLSFTEWNGFSERDIRWVGLQNYRQLFAIESARPVDDDGPWYWAVLGGRPRDPRFFTAVYNTLIFALVAAPLGLVAALLLAVLLNQKLRGISFFRCAFYMPHLLGGVGTILMWQWLFNPDVGLINSVLRIVFESWAWLAGLLGFEPSAFAPPRWLHSPSWCKPALVLMHLWGSGGSMLIFLAALQNIPPRLYEASRLDGAGRWRQFPHVTQPQISPAILFNFVIGLIGAMRVFKSAYVLRHWSQQDGLLFYMVHLYESAFEDPARLGYASALSWVLFVVLFVLTLVTVSVSRRWVYYAG